MLLPDHQSLRRRLARIALPCLAAALLHGCVAWIDSDKDEPAAGSPQTGGPHEVRLLELGRIYGPRQGGSFGWIGAIAPDRQGGLYLYDDSAAVLHHFDATLGRRSSVGRRGDRPGEFGHLIGLAVTNDGVWTVDGSNARYTFFSHERVALDARRAGTSDRVPWLGGIDQRGMMYDAVVDPSDGSEVLLALKLSGALDEKLHLPAMRIELPPRDTTQHSVPVTTQPSLPFTPTVLRAFDPTGATLVARSDTYRVLRVSFAKEPTAVFAHAVADTVEAARLSWLASDDRGRVWVGRWAPDGAPVVDLFDGSTDAPHELRLPFALAAGSVPAIWDDRLFAVVDADSGGQQVRVVRIQSTGRHVAP